MTQGSAMLLLPNQITAAMIAAGTSVPVVDSARGEVAWSIGTAYTGVETKINDGGKLWAAVAASTGVKPGTDATKWRETGPSNRMAAFDDKLSTRSVGAGELKLVIKPGFFNGLALYGLVGEQLEITLRNTPGGAIIYQWIGDMFEQPFGLFEYLYMPLRQITKRLAADLAMGTDAELTIRITAAGSGVCGVGMVVCGFWETLLGTGEFGGVEYGASAEIKTYSYIKTEEDGSTSIAPRASATNINCSVVIDAEQANKAADVLTQVLAKPVAIVLSGLPRYEYLNTFGLISGNVTADTWRTAKLQITGKGYI